MQSSTTWKEKCRQFGLQRLAIAAQAKTTEEWQQMWKAPAHPYPFTWGPCWKQCIEYRVEDHAAELGFFVDILGLECNALGNDFAMLTNEAGDFYFAIRPCEEGSSTPPDALNLQFMLSNIQETAIRLEQRGIVFEKPVQPYEPNSPMLTGTFRTPHGIAVDLWGMG